MSEIMSIESLEKHFDGIHAVRNARFSINSGEVLALIGPNGAGKTTLLNMISGYIAPTSGQIYWQGQQISRWPVQKRARSGIARTFQKTRLFFNQTVEENLKTGAYVHLPGGIGQWTSRLKGAGHQKRLTMTIDELLERTGLAGYKHHRASELSFGYQRRLEIALALASRPKLLLMDEPFGGLSPESMSQIGHLIQALQTDGMSIVFIEHRMESVINYCTRLLAMRNGQILVPNRPPDRTHA